MNKKIITCFLTMMFVFSNVIQSHAFENPAVLTKRSSFYTINLPESNGGYVFDKVMTQGLSLKSPLLETGYVLMNASFKTELTPNQVNKSKEAINKLVTDSSKEYSLKYLEKNLGTRFINVIRKADNMNSVMTTYNQLKNNLKNDTTDYKLNIVLNRKLGFTSKSRLGAIEAYNYSRTAVKDLMKKGHITVKMPPKGQSLYRATITMTKTGKRQMQIIKSDRDKIIKEHERRNIK